jgi:alkanesulfonate monooxygenase SsuD/methylene tetrahydromethanopterin reductase-like flavin-dependent oxidoreductase (luciferase family)
VGALTPKSLRQCGEIADGIMPVHWPTSQMSQLRDYLREGAELVGRDPMDVTIAPHTVIYVLDGVDDERTLWEAKRPLENYINRMGNFYHEMMTRTGWADEVRAVQESWAEKKDRDAAIEGISDKMVREIQLVGTMPEVKERLRERADAGADMQIVYMPKGTPAEAGTALKEFISA